MNMYVSSNRNVKLLFWATLFGSVTFLEPIMVLFYMQRGLDPSSVFWVTFAWCSAVLLFEVPTGAFADRFGPKASFIFGCALNITSNILLIFAHDFLMLMIFNILWGASVTFFSGAEEALIYESLKENKGESRMGEVLGKISSATYIPMIFTFIFGAYFAKDLQEWQFISLILLTICFQLVQLFILMKVSNPRDFGKFRENPFTHVKNGLNLIRQTPDIIKLFLNFTIVFIPSFVIFGKVEQPYLTQAGLPVAWLGVFYAGMALMGLLISQNIGRLQKRVSNISIMRLSGLAAVIALGIASFAFGQTLVFATIVFLVVRMTRVIRYPVFSQMTNEYIPSESRATTLSLLSIGDSVFDLLMLTIFAGIATMGMSPVFAISAVICTIGVLIPIREKR
ncbi:MFS transporter [Brevibacillus sp. SYSU BS000544]|uniref:MFS transporter n=1 Tax=Brevibacillus sp. SYSU BS000544 TaxID=3416443 RepID=UPI003CE48E88